MNRPEVRIIQSQEVETKSEQELSQSEINSLLAKYGYSNTQLSINNHTPEPPKNNMTFDEMVRLEENKLKAEEERKRLINNGPKSVTFDQRNVGYSETKYGTLDDEMGIGIQISIVSDMNLPKY
jgi:hypothetical protein